MARTTRLDQKLQQAICKRVEQGDYPETAAVAEGVPARTYREWARLGRQQEDDEKSPYGLLFLAVERARARCESDLVAQVRKGDTKDAKTAKAAAWLLERTRSKRFGAVIRHRVEDELERMLDVAERVLSREDFRRLCEAIAAADRSDEVGEAQLGGGSPGEQPTKTGGVH